MTIADDLLLLADTKERLRRRMGLGADVPFADYVNELPFTPYELFMGGKQGVFYDFINSSSLYQNTNGTTAVTANGDPVAFMTDKSGNGNNATQPISARRATYNVSPPSLKLDKVDDAIEINVPTGGWVGTMVLATGDGTVTYRVNLPAGIYTVGGPYFYSSSINGLLLVTATLSKSESDEVEGYFTNQGAKASFGDVNSFLFAWHKNNLTSFPLINTSKVINFKQAWSGNQLTSFPLIDTSKGFDFTAAWDKNRLKSFPLIDTSNATVLFAAWRDNQLTSFPAINTSEVIDFNSAWANNQLTSFPLIDISKGLHFNRAWYSNPLVEFPSHFFDNVKSGSFSQAFLGTNLSQESIDGILVSLVASGISTGTRSFSQSRGSAPSQMGEAAIDTLRLRGWTVTVTGGY